MLFFLLSARHNMKLTKGVTPCRPICLTGQFYYDCPRTIASAEIIRLANVSVALEPARGPQSFHKAISSIEATTKTPHQQSSMISVNSLYLPIVDLHDHHVVGGDLRKID